MSDEVASALSVVESDAERIPDNLVPPGSSVEKVLGALIARVADGKPLEPLSDEALGIAPPPEEGNPPAPVGEPAPTPAPTPTPEPAPAPVPVPDEPPTAEEVEQLRKELDEARAEESADETEIAELKKENERLKEEAKTSSGSPSA